MKVIKFGKLFYQSFSAAAPLPLQSAGKYYQCFPQIFSMAFGRTPAPFHPRIFSTVGDIRADALRQFDIDLLDIMIYGYFVRGETNLYQHHSFRGGEAPPSAPGAHRKR